MRPSATRTFHYNILQKFCQAKYCIKIKNIFSRNLCKSTKSEKRYKKDLTFLLFWVIIYT
nr:MAG TPA: hypothetical protein [Caudoviricetes sp.]